MVEPTESKREEILNVAARMFSTTGFHETSVRDIARECNISQPTLYYYIGSKNELMAKVYALGMCELVERLEEISRSEQPLDEKLRSYCRVRMQMIDHKDGRPTVFFRERRWLPPPAAFAIQGQRDRVDEILDLILQEGVAAGLFVEMPPKTTRLAIQGMLNWTIEWWRPDGPLTADQLADRFSELILRGLLPRLPGSGTC